MRGKLSMELGMAKGFSGPKNTFTKVKYDIIRLLFRWQKTRLRNSYLQEWGGL
jgi:hypothetical protein